MDNTGRALREWLRIAYMQGRKIERLAEQVKRDEITPEQAWRELAEPIPPEAVIWEGTFCAVLGPRPRLAPYPVD